MFSHEKRYTHCPEKESLHMRSESGTCNVCAAPCSSCMHYNRAVPAMESTVEDCFSEDIDRGNEATQCISSNVPINRSRNCDDRQHVTSESSNIFSASSSHDSVSENAESKASMKNCGTYDASENVVMPLNLSGETVKGGDQHRFVQSDFTSPQNQGVSGVWNASSSDVYEDQRVLECHGDNISCIRGDRVRGVTAASSSLMEDLDRKNIFPSVCSKESLEKKGSSLSSATVGFSHQSHILESPVLKDVHTVGQESVAHGSSSILGRVENSNTICLRANCSSENQVDMVNEKQPDKDTGCVVENRQSEMTNSLSDSDLQDSKVEMDHESNHSDSENLLDVKVCDICGDAGREDLLAFCSRCTDGAEHTYCMKIMLDKVPEANWVCEGCILKEESEKQKLDKFETKLGRESSFERTQNFGGTLNSGILSKSSNQPIDVEVMPNSRGLKGLKIPCKRSADSTEVSSVSKQRAPDMSNVSPRATSTSKKPSLSRESSFKSLDIGKVKPINLAQLPGNQVSNNPQAVPPSPSSSLNSSRMRPQSSRGFLSKSTSFNNFGMKPKVKPGVEDIFQKPKLAGGSSSGNTKKEAAFRNKSMSFKNISSVQSSFRESRSFGSPRVEDPRGLKERNSLEKKNSSRSEHPIVGSAVGTSVPFQKGEEKVISCSETGSVIDFHKKNMQFDGKLTSPRSGSTLSNKGSEVQPNSAGSSDVKRQVTYSGRSTDIPSSNGTCNTQEQKPSVLGAPDKPSGNLDLIQQRILSIPREFVNRDEKSRDLSSISGSRQTTLVGGRRCNKCNETGHTTQFCPIDKLRDSAFKVSAERNLKEVTRKNNKWKDAVEAAMSRTKRHSNNKLIDQSDDILLSSSDLSCEGVSKDQFSHPSSCRSGPSLQGTSDVLDSLKSSTADTTKTSSVIDVKQEIIPMMENVCARNTGKLKLIPSISDEMIAKNSLGNMAIPVHNYIWQGCFEVQRTGNLPELCDGIQAHLSSCASSKVPDVVMKFPCKIQMEEVPRKRSWPLHFQESGATEDNIALYFFAKDLESYEGYYKKLLENMIENDFALKGEICGIELLIFPSNKLPEKSQRWNRLFFLWGVFRERKSNCSVPSSGLQNNNCVTNLGSSLQNQPSPLLLEINVSQNLNNYQHIQREDLRSSQLPKTCEVTRSSKYMDFSSSLSSVSDDRNSDALPNYSNSNSLARADSCDMLSSAKQISCTVSKILPLKNVHGDLERVRDAADVQNYSIDVSTNRTADVLSDPSKMFPPNHFLVQEAGAGDMEKEHNKRECELHSRSLEGISPASGETSNGTREARTWLDRAADDLPLDEHKHMEMRPNTGKHCTPTAGEQSFTKSFTPKSPFMDLNSPAEELEGDELFDEAHVPKASGSTEKYFFPDLDPSRECVPVQVISSDDEDTPEPNAPNLELALKLPRHEVILPSHSELLGSTSNGGEDGGPASLFLSLGFPILGKEQTPISQVTNQENPLPPTRQVDTSLLLFRG